MPEDEYFLPSEKDWEDIAGLTWEEFIAHESSYIERGWGYLLRWDSLAQLLKEPPSPIRREKIFSLLRVHYSEVRWEEAYNKTAIEKEHLEFHVIPEMQTKLEEEAAAARGEAETARQELQEAKSIITTAAEKVLRAPSRNSSDTPQKRFSANDMLRLNYEAGVRLEIAGIPPESPLYQECLKAVQSEMASYKLRLLGRQAPLMTPERIQTIIDVKRMEWAAKQLKETEEELRKRREEPSPIPLERRLRALAFQEKKVSLSPGEFETSRDFNLRAGERFRRMLMGTKGENPQSATEETIKAAARAAALEMQNQHKELSRKGGKLGRGIIKSPIIVSLGEWEKNPRL